MTHYGECLRDHLRAVTLLAAEVQELSDLAERNGFFDLANKLDTAAMAARQLKVTMKWRRTTELLRSVSGAAISAAQS